MPPPHTRTHAHTKEGLETGGRTALKESRGAARPGQPAARDPRDHLEVASSDNRGGNVTNKKKEKKRGEQKGGFEGVSVKSGNIMSQVNRQGRIVVRRVPAHLGLSPFKQPFEQT